MNGFADTTVFITGIGSGMGLASAQRMIAAGAHVVGFARNIGAQTCAALEDRRANPAQRIALFAVDVSDREATLETLRAACAQCGAPDLLIHMAGIGGVGEMREMPFEHFDRIMKINVYGTRHVVEALLPALLARAAGGGKRPRLLLVGSMGGFVPVYGYTAYGTSKFAVVGFAKCLRYELAPLGIDVACYCPGEVATPGLELERANTHLATLALKRIGGTMSMERAIDGLVAGLRRNRFLIVPGWRTRVVHLALRLAPERLWNAVTDRVVARALRSTV